MSGVIPQLFVYGTLMPGAINWAVLVQWSTGTPAPDSIEGQLFDTYLGYPAAVIGAAGSIPGFVVPLDPARLDRALGALDDFEDVSAGLYKRVELLTTNRVQAWAYHWLGSVDGMRRIPTWRA